MKAALDPKGRNTSFWDYQAIEKRARQWLVEEHVRRFTELSPRQKTVIDLTIALRNNLAHRSESSFDRLNAVLQLGPLHETGLQRNVNNVQRAGIYLKSRSADANRETRAKVLAGLLRESAHEIVR